MYDRFLVPLDGSKLAEVAAAHAAELARQCQAELVLLRICLDSKNLREAVDYLDRVGEQARAEDLKVRCEAYLGDPSRRIVQTATEEGVDLIIMSSHGRTGLARSIFGSVAETVMRQSPCPVMVVPAAARPQIEDAEEVA
jgi:nucleotide-binding universal stress UspA family protein